MRAPLPVVIAGLCLVLVGCGGGSSGNSPNTLPAPMIRESAVGQWGGTLNISSGGARDFSGVVLDDGTFWFQYAIPGNAAVLGGVFVGNASDMPRQFESNSLREYNFDGSSSGLASASGNYLPQQTLNGTLAPATLIGLPSTPTATFATLYDSAYDLLPTTSTLAGRYLGSGAFGPTSGFGAPQFAPMQFTADFTVTDNGDVSGIMTVSTGFPCPFTGDLSPRTTGNVYSITLTFSPVCGGLPTYEGITFIDGNNVRVIAEEPGGTGAGVIATRL